MEAAFAWDEDRVAVLTKMIAENCSARIIAERLGTSRNAVLGKTHRMGITAPEKPKSTRVYKTRATMHRPRPRIVRDTHNANSVRIIPAAEVAQHRLRCVELVPLNVTLMDLPADGCRYIAGDDLLFCGHPQMAGSSWCTPHHHLCLEKPRAPIHRFAGFAA